MSETAEPNESAESEREKKERDERQTKEEGGESRGATLGIGAVARRTGLSPDVLRVWERRHHAVEPFRTAGGTRLYSESQVRRLEMLAALVAGGHRIGRLARLSDDALAALFFEDGRAGGIAEVASPPLASLDGGCELIERALEALETVDSARVEQLLTPAFLSLGPRDFTLEVALPLLREVGEHWAAGRLSVAAEHAAVAVLRTLLGASIRRHPNRDARRRALFATPTGQRHEFGILAAALLASGVGLDTIYLGCDVPVVDIAETVRFTEAGIVVIGLAPHDGDLEDEIEHLRRLRDALPATVELWIGGAVSATVSRALGLKAFASLEAFEGHAAAIFEQGSRRGGTA